MDPHLSVIERSMFRHPPALVWRVGHAGNRDALVRARLTSAYFETDNDFQRAKSQHLDWCNRDWTPFLSVFSSKVHAELWGRKLLDKGDVWIYPVDTYGLAVFPTHTGELLILGEIPKNNIGEGEQVRELVDDELCNDLIPGQEGLVHNERTGLNYEPGDEAIEQEDEDWVDFVEYQIDH
ncbi:hypothetical protein JG687_00008819 [Phytophthora cactorum]|uniref:Uncharacterized protein n=1 Tax=Phytophthora cactorum TaxID=29920 RepID=A0A329RVG7_9STRA|nr:hypothetical protein GQ600_18516 [Phytophthora cactorum]KAG2784631.1 hypothetical protein Pcac1_g5900 [Phytophthora cactorum]KAG2816662.1 hypothetical protein PC111_g13043 [Phytophthora cactorum]KAG2817354.1 hypothetical protein PC112_g13089 [Phytophthora cactorum]KAG2853244.1 hypothetical protein PC113_g14320 [Phytophthora cactorum]